MRSSRPGTGTSDVEVTSIDRHGLWVFVAGREHFLPFGKFPWFREAKVDQILNVELLHQSHLRWPELDVDLCLESLEDPDAFPLEYR